MRRRKRRKRRKRRVKRMVRLETVLICFQRMISWTIARIPVRVQPLPRQVELKKRCESTLDTPSTLEQ